MHPMTNERKTIILTILIIGILGFLIYVASQQTNKPPTQNPTGNKAAIIDHLSISQPNQTFIENATSILQEAGYEVHYFKGEQVTVDFYKNLPSQGFSFIIFRVHSTGESTVQNMTLD